MELCGPLPPGEAQECRCSEAHIGPPCVPAGDPLSSLWLCAERGARAPATCEAQREPPALAVPPHPAGRGAPSEATRRPAASLNPATSPPPGSSVGRNGSGSRSGGDLDVSPSWAKLSFLPQPPPQQAPSPWGAGAAELKQSLPPAPLPPAGCSNPQHSGLPPAAGACQSR